MGIDLTFADYKLFVLKIVIINGRNCNFFQIYLIPITSNTTLERKWRAKFLHIKTFSTVPSNKIDNALFLKAFDEKSFVSYMRH